MSEEYRCPPFPVARRGGFTANISKQPIRASRMSVVMGKPPGQ